MNVLIKVEAKGHLKEFCFLCPDSNSLNATPFKCNFMTRRNIRTFLHAYYILKKQLNKKKVGLENKYLKKQDSI